MQPTETDTPEVDPAAAAREARRLRILENCNERLTRLTGRTHNVEIPKAEPIVADTLYPDPEMERDVYQQSVPAFMNPNDDIFEMLKTMQGGGGMGGMSSATPSAPPAPETPTSRFLRSKTPVVIIALVVYALFALNLDFLVGGAVFSSLIVWEIFEFILTTFVVKRQQQQQPSLINILFAFGGIRPERAQLVMKLLGIINKVIRDIAIFLFTFVLVHLAWSFLIVGESLTEILDKDFNNLLKRDEL